MSEFLTILIKVAWRLFSVLRERHQLLLRQVPIMRVLA